MTLFVTAAGVGPLPALGSAFNPGTGAWTMAADAWASHQPQTLRLAGLRGPVQVVLEKDGTAHVTAASDHDLFLATGYMHARFRLFQMDLMRRQGAGRLSEVVGSAALDSDRFELRLGLLRTAQAEWNALPAGDPSRAVMEAYSQGVNDRIREATASHQLPALFTLLGYAPKPWTPVDSLLVQGDMTQDLDFTDTPLVMAQVVKALGPQLASAWFPVIAPNTQTPYDPGPYAAAEPPARMPSMRQVAQAEADAARALLASLPPERVAQGGNSNNWAVAGSRSVSGGALLAGDPHLHLTLPAIWFQLTMDAPGYHASGVSIPGTPGILIGHNRDISWSLTNGQNQATFYYEEKEDAAHPGQYFWQGAWRDYRTVGYDIPVKGAATEHLDVKLSVHGPVMTERGLTTSVWWAGNLPSPDLSVLYRIGQASDFTGFRNALRDWHAPSQNFMYADARGHIGVVSAGYYPLIRGGQPWLPLAGTGESDVIGTIPFDQIPQAYDPPTGILWTANQRQVGPDYPYYIGTASNFFDPGYRSNEIHRYLSDNRLFTAADMKALQNDTRDYLAGEITPRLLSALSGASLSDREAAARDLLAAGDGRMETGSAAASVWWTFWQSYLAATFDPWWKAAGVTVAREELNAPLGQDLEAWTLAGVGSAAFSPPGGAVRNATDVMRAAFKSAVAELAKSLGPAPATWSWGRLHQRQLDSLAQIDSLDFGPEPDRGDAYTPLAAGDFPSSHGPSWRMVVDWGTGAFEGVYPGGQSENPASGWYTDRVTTWWSGLYKAMTAAEEAGTQAGSVTWRFRP